MDTSRYAEAVRKLSSACALGALMGVVAGVMSALFLFLLDEVTRARGSHGVIVFALPLAGLLLGVIYDRFGRSIDRGSDLVIDTIHDDGPEIPLRMAPMVLFGTLVTHLFGGSAGREGTAVQMSASLADFIAHRLRLPSLDRRQLLSAGVAAGFGSVFGTPFAGTLFGLEFVVLGRLEYGALVPSLVAAIVGDATTRAIGIVHTPYPVLAQTSLTPRLFIVWILFAAAVALAARAFVELVRFLKKEGAARLPRRPVRMLVGGAAVVVLFVLVGTDDYLGLGLPTILRAFSDGHLPAYVFALKIVFTAVTIGTGFIGGEVTPLFFIGATLGSVLASLLGLPIALGAAMGLVSMFSAAAHTPLAMSIMAVELFGGHALPHAVIVCVLAHVFAAGPGIYGAQRLPPETR